MLPSITTLDPFVSTAKAIVEKQAGAPLEGVLSLGTSKGEQDAGRPSKPAGKEDARPPGKPAERTVTSVEIPATRLGKKSLGDEADKLFRQFGASGKPEPKQSDR